MWLFIDHFKVYWGESKDFTRNSMVWLRCKDLLGTWFLLNENVLILELYLCFWGNLCFKIKLCRIIREKRPTGKSCKSLIKLLFLVYLWFIHFINNFSENHCLCSPDYIGHHYSLRRGRHVLWKTKLTVRTEQW